MVEVPKHIKDGEEEEKGGVLDFLAVLFLCKAFSSCLRSGSCSCSGLSGSMSSCLCLGPEISPDNHCSAPRPSALACSVLYLRNVNFAKLCVTACHPSAGDLSDKTPCILLFRLPWVSPVLSTRYYAFVVYKAQ